MDFISRLKSRWQQSNSLLCVGLDPDQSKLPESIKNEPASFFEFNKAIISATADIASAFKPNSAFYEALGPAGLEQLKATCDYIKQNYSDIPIILDFKRGDIGHTNSYYAQLAFDYLGVDAVTVQPYMGREAVQTLLDYKDKGIIVLCRTSNSGAGEFQDLTVDGRKLYEIVADNVVKEWNKNNNCLLVVGATYPTELASLRKQLGEEMIFLVPGIGAQGASVEETLKAGLNKYGDGLIINSARDIIYASSEANFAEAARLRAEAIRDEINKYRKAAE